MIPSRNCKSNLETPSWSAAKQLGVSLRLAWGWPVCFELIVRRRFESGSKSNRETRFDIMLAPQPVSILTILRTRQFLHVQPVLINGRNQSHDCPCVFLSPRALSRSQRQEFGLKLTNRHENETNSSGQYLKHFPGVSRQLLRNEVYASMKSSVSR